MVCFFFTFTYLVFNVTFYLISSRFSPLGGGLLGRPRKDFALKKTNYQNRHRQNTERGNTREREHKQQTSAWRRRFQNATHTHTITTTKTNRRRSEETKKTAKIIHKPISSGNPLNISIIKVVGSMKQRGSGMTENNLLLLLGRRRRN